MVNELVNFFMRPLVGVPIEQLVGETIAEHDDDIVELNLAQLAEGKKGDGSDIEPEYADSTKKARQKEGLQTDHVDLNRKGSFYKGTFAKRISGGTEVSSDDRKTGFLTRKYGEGIFGLTPASRDQLAERMKPTLQAKFSQALK